MELIWLEDFEALAKCGSFAKAAEARNMTQPAFGRRIRSLEAWVGVELFVRSPQGASLTEAGKHVRSIAQDAASKLYRIRTEAQEVAGKAARTLKFAATHSLSFTFFPRWVRSAERGAPIEAVRLHSDNMSICEQMLVHGHVQFLLCHQHPDVPPRLPPARFISKQIGEDVLLPLAGTSAEFDPFPASLPYLAYTQESGLGRIVSHQLHGNDGQLQLRTLFSSHLAAVLMSMALENKGVAWLPKSLSEQEIVDGRLSRQLDERWDIPLQIHLTRPAAPLSPFAEEFWARLP
jgi:DNA-binding transcriptional LysR family regulator